MNATRLIPIRRMTAFRRAAALIITVLVLTFAAATLAAQTSVFVPGNASGDFGYPTQNVIVRLIPALTVSGPGTITVTYVSGTVDWAPGKPTGPGGAPWPYSGCQLPLQEVNGVSQKRATNIGALMGVFVPQRRTQEVGFSAIDGTKNATPAGILPTQLKFVGTSRTFTVTEAGTLYLGINDCEVADNSGGFNVTVTTP